MAGSDDIFEFLNDVFDTLPDQDISRFGELWRAIEQTYGNVMTKMFERDLGVGVNNVTLYNNERWLQHIFDSTTQVSRAATYRSNQDLSIGLDLTTRSLIKVGVDGGTPVEINLAGTNPASTKNYEIVEKINNAVGFAFVKLVVNNALLQFTSSTLGPTSRITFYPASLPLQDASALVLGLDPGDLPIEYPKFPYEYQLGDTAIVDIPILRDTVHENLATVTLNEKVDYDVEFGSAIISFAAEPPAKMWAKNNLKNLETPYNNFGYLMDFYDSNKPGYLKAVRGLWFAFWTGPRPENIRRSLYLLFGLPTATLPGTVTDVTPTQITLTYTTGQTEVFTIPIDLEAIVAIGDTVEKFQPLVSGITVLDKISKKGFVASEVGRYGIQPFLTEKATRGLDPSTDESKALTTIEENVYLPQIDVNAFISPDIKLSNIQTFLRNIQPKSRTYLFQVLVGVFKEPLVLNELLGLDISFDVTPNVDYNPNLECQQSDRVAAETVAGGMVLDSEVMTFTDRLDIDVYHGVTLVDSFAVEG